MRTLHWGVLCAALLAPGVALAQGGGTPVRTGNHPGFGRVVFDLPPGAGYEVVTEGSRVLLVFGGAGAVQEPGSVPRNVRAIRTGLDTATVELTPGARARTVRLGDRVVVDALDPVPRTGRPVSKPVEAKGEGSAPLAPLGPQAAEKPPASPEARPAIARPDPPRELPREASPEAVAVGSAPVTPVQAETLPPSQAVAAPAAVEPAPSPASQPAPAPSPEARPPFTILADLDVGAAAFRRGDRAVLVLDRRLPPQSVPAGVTWSAGVVTTVVHWPLVSDAAVGMTRTVQGWTVAPGPSRPATGLAMAPGREGLGLTLERPGRAVTVLDPVTGGTLLVGTSLSGGAGAGVAEARWTPDYRVLPSWLGVVAEPTADRVDLRAAATGFTLLGAPPPALADATAQTRRFELRDEPMPEALNRMRAQLAGAAGSAARARSRDRLAAVQSMIALGLGPEAQALVQVVMAEDPQAAADAETVALGAMAALMAGRDADAAGLDDPRLAGTDEMAMWRGLRDRRAGRDTPAARQLGTFAPLAWSYPASLRRHVWADVAEAAVEAGATIPADRLPPYARALAQERAGNAEAALAAYDAVAAGADRLDQVRAGARAAELRLAAGQIKPLDAATAMERQSFAWRGDAREAGFRMRAAELQAAAGQWRPALDALRGIEAAFPEQKAAIQAHKAGVIHAMLSVEGSTLSALDVVLLASDYADAVPDGPGGTAMARLLAAKLAALDLPARAIPVLQGLVRTAPAGEARAEFGVRLAQLLLDAGDEAGARTAMEASAAPGLPAPLRESRGLVLARAMAGTGDAPGAAAVLSEIGTEATDDLRAALLVRAGEWRGALQALADLAAKRVPAQGPLTPGAQDVLLRQASAAAQLPDPALLRSLAASAGRLEGQRAELFRMLTAAPVDATTDLPRASRELAALRGLPQRMQAIGTR